MTEIDITIDGDVSDADALHVAKQITATGARYRVTGPLAEALARMNAAAYERGQRDMREKAAKTVEPGNWPEHRTMASTLKVAAAAIRALPTDRGDG